MPNEPATLPLYGIAIDGGWLTRADTTAGVSATDNPNFAYCYRSLEDATAAAKVYDGKVAPLPKRMW